LSQFKQFDSLEGFIQGVPRNLQENLQFRIDLHTLLSKDIKLQNLYKTMCLIAPQILFDTCFWTPDPRKAVGGAANYPFILRPKQIRVENTLNWCIDNGHDAGIDKSREEGASEICAKLLAAKCLLTNEAYFILGSRKKELVDNFGDNQTLFAKVDHVFKYLPSWWKSQVHLDRKDMLLKVKETDSTVRGETTNESFSAGYRATAMVLDEFGRVEKRIADAIESSIHDVTHCVIYSSTHWLGIGHTFNECLHKETTKVVTLPWYENPVKAEGLYETPQPGVVRLLDVEYYRQNFPRLFDYVNIV